MNKNYIDIFKNNTNCKNTTKITKMNMKAEYIKNKIIQNIYKKKSFSMIVK